MVPLSSNPKWGQLLKKEVAYEYEFLALKIALARYQRKIEFNEMTLDAAKQELINFFKTNEQSLTNDIKKIFG